MWGPEWRRLVGVPPRVGRRAHLRAARARRRASARCGGRGAASRRARNGPVEGLVNKLKLVKRQGYGRAGFDLLRARVLAS